MATEQCCCFDLRTGSLIIIWLNLVFSIIGILAGNIFISGISLVVEVLGIYAILQNKPEYLWPQMIWQTLHFIVISIGVIIIFALALFFGSGDLPRNVDHNTQRLLETAQNYRFPVLLLAFGILALAFYLLKVVIIYYQEMKKEIPAYTQTITNMERGYVPQYEPQAVQLDHMSGAFKQ